MIILKKMKELIQFIKDVNSLRSTYIDDIIDSNDNFRQYRYC